MKTRIFSVLFALCAMLQGTAQTITLAVNANNLSSSHAVATNQIIQIASLTSSYGILPNVGLFHSSGIEVTTTNIGTYTDLTNIVVSDGSGKIGVVNGYSDGLVTLTITTPTCNVVSNYVPADAIVIPASATGNVQIILESSPDLVNWTAAEPGIYGAAAGTNRFFRVHAIVSP